MIMQTMRATLTHVMSRLSLMKRMSVGVVAIFVAGLNVTGSPRAAARECSGEAWLAKSSSARIKWRVMCAEGTGDLGILLSPGFSRSKGPVSWPSDFSRSLTVKGEAVARRCTLSKARGTVACHTTREGVATFKGWVSVEQGKRCRDRLVISGSAGTSVQRPSILEPPKERLFSGMPKGCG
jgi:hypothetical protein